MHTINLISVPEKHSLWVSPIDKPEFQKLLRSRGIDISSNAPSAKWDMVNCSEYDGWKVEGISEDRPTILLDLRDAASTDSVLVTYLNQSNVKICIRPNTYVPRSIDNEKHHDLLYWADRLLTKIPPEHEPWPNIIDREPLGEIALNKIQTISNIAWGHGYENCKWFNDEPPRGKPIDIFSLGCMNSYWTRLVRYHRRLCLDAIKSLPDYYIKCIGASTTTKDPIRINDGWHHMPGSGEFFRLLQNSKVVVSPYGYGEMSFKDWEAVMSATVIIKPHMDHVEINPSPYSDFNTVYCEPDFSDLANVAKNVLKNWGSFQESTLHWRNVWLDRISTYDYLVDIWDKTLSPILNSETKGVGHWKTRTD